MRTFVVILVLCRCAHAFGADDAPVKIGPKSADPAAFGIGTTIADARLKFLDGKTGLLSDYSDRAVLVIAVVAPDCPVSQKYAPRLAELRKKYCDQRVACVLLNSSGDSTDTLRNALQRTGLNLPVILDADGAVARSLHAKMTTDAFVLDASRKLIYRGAIDDQYGVGYEHAAPRQNFLADAIDAALADRAVARPATLAPGCELSLPTAPAVSAQTVTYHQEISRLMQNNCQQCHHPGAAGPFPLLSYDDVKRKAGVIRRVTSTRVMPPWFADNSVGHEWANNRRLGDADLQMLLDWIDAKCPEGEAKDEPPPRKWEAGWNIGIPDAIVQIPKPVQVPAQGRLPYQFIKVATHFPEDKWVQAVELLPTNPALVHHSQVFVVTAEGKQLWEPAPTDGGRPISYFAAMVPGETALVFQEGCAKLLPKGCTLLFEIHYSPNGAAAEDQMRVGMIFAKSAPKFEVKSFDIRNGNLLIPPGEANYSQSAEYTFETRAKLLAFQPHMHLRGKAFSFELIFPDGKKEPVLSVPRYDFNWQTSYRLKEPWEIPKGARLRVTGCFDNSKNNPANPDPTQTVRGGGETTDEMMVGFGEWCALPDK
jgi:peroxiredoxin